MTKSELLSKIESKIRPNMMWLPPHFITNLYSTQKLKFLNNFFKEVPEKHLIENQNVIFWGINFNIPIFNAAGMFKNGYGYQLVANQGAGAYLCGTTTAEVRKGNLKDGIYLPFTPYPNSGSASNWMGLPNEGHSIVAKRLSEIQKVKGCPIGASVSITGDTNLRENLEQLIDGIKLYDKANIDFIEFNESCPNVADVHHKIEVNDLDRDLIKRMEFVSSNFLSKRNRKLPLILKLSNDTNPDLIPAMIDIMIDLNFDGLNLGNTSTDYINLKSKINPKDKKSFKYFTENFGGGLSGNIVKEKSLNLVSVAANYLKTKKLSYEFHLIRTGGIENYLDFAKSIESGASLCQWYTGYFSNFAKNGHKLYDMLLNQN